MEKGYADEISQLPPSAKQTALQDVYVDVSQNPKFGPMASVASGAADILGCLCTSTCLYSYGRDRALLPIEHMYLQGHRRGFSIPDRMPSNRLRQLAGEGMSLPCLATVIWSMYLVKGLP